MKDSPHVPSVLLVGLLFVFTIFGRNRQERHHQPMRFISRLWMLVVFSLAVGLACSEMPELFSVADDPSNDFVLSTCTFESSVDRAALERPNCPTSNSLMMAPISTVSRRGFVLKPAPLTGADLLLFLSTRRN